MFRKCSNQLDSTGNLTSKFSSNDKFFDSDSTDEDTNDIETGNKNFNNNINTNYEKNDEQQTCASIDSKFVNLGIRDGTYFTRPKYHPSRGVYFIADDIHSSINKKTQIEQPQRTFVKSDSSVVLCEPELVNKEIEIIPLKCTCGKGDNTENLHFRKMKNKPNTQFETEPIKIADIMEADKTNTPSHNAPILEEIVVEDNKMLPDPTKKNNEQSEQINHGTQNVLSADEKFICGETIVIRRSIEETAYKQANKTEATMKNNWSEMVPMYSCGCPMERRVTRFHYSDGTVMQRSSVSPQVIDKTTF